MDGELMEYSIILSNIEKSYDVSLAQAIDPMKKVREMLFSSQRKESSGAVKSLALKGINLKINHGERVGIIGENGAGKSTLLGVIAGTISPSGGTIDIKGKVNAILTLGLGLRDDFTGRENFFLAGEMYGLSQSDIKSKMDEMIAFCELGKFIDFPMRCYSSGMKARLAFTSIVFFDPEILIVDEALSVGDQWFSPKATEKMKTLCASGKILLLVSHSLESIVQMCDRCIWMEKGEIKADGDPIEITALYREYVKNKDRKSLATQKVKKSNGCIIDFRLQHQGYSTGLYEILDEDLVEFLFSLNEKVSRKQTVVVFNLNSTDGINVAMSRQSLQDFPEVLNGITIQVGKGQLMVKPGYYKASLQLECSGKEIDFVEFEFQVFSNHKFLGGNPILRWPATINVEKLG